LKQEYLLALLHLSEKEDNSWYKYTTNKILAATEAHRSKKIKAPEPISPQPIATNDQSGKPVSQIKE